MKEKQTCFCCFFPSNVISYSDTCSTEKKKAILCSCSFVSEGWILTHEYGRTISFQVHYHLVWAQRLALMEHTPSLTLTPWTQRGREEKMSSWATEEQNKFMPGNKMGGSGGGKNNKKKNSCGTLNSPFCFPPSHVQTWRWIQGNGLGKKHVRKLRAKNVWWLRYTQSSNYRSAAGSSAPLRHTGPVKSLPRRLGGALINWPLGSIGLYFALTTLYAPEIKLHVEQCVSICPLVFMSE